MKRQALICWSLVVGLFISFFSPTAVFAAEIPEPVGGYFGTYRDVYQTQQTVPPFIEGYTPDPVGSYSQPKKVISYPSGSNCWGAINTCTFPVSVTADYNRATLLVVGTYVGIEDRSVTFSTVNATVVDTSNFTVDLKNLPSNLGFGGSVQDIKDSLVSLYSEYDGLYVVNPNLTNKVMNLNETFGYVGFPINAESYYDVNDFGGMVSFSLYPYSELAQIDVFIMEQVPFLENTPAFIPTDFSTQWASGINFPEPNCTSTNLNGVQYAVGSEDLTNMFAGSFDGRFGSLSGLFSWTKEENSCFDQNDWRFGDGLPVFNQVEPQPQPPTVDPPIDPTEPGVVPETPPQPDTPGAGQSPEECSFGDIACYFGSLFMPTKDFNQELSDMVGTGKIGGLANQFADFINALYSPHACTDINFNFGNGWIINFDPCVDQISQFLRPITTLVGWVAILVLLVVYIWKIFEPNLDGS